jgi:hypothetical protein
VALSLTISVPHTVEHRDAGSDRRGAVAANDRQRLVQRANGGLTSPAGRALVSKYLVDAKPSYLLALILGCLRWDVNSQAHIRVWICFPEGLYLRHHLFTIGARLLCRDLSPGVANLNKPVSRLHVKLPDFARHRGIMGDLSFITTIIIVNSLRSAKFTDVRSFVPLATLAAALISGACTDTADVFPLNAAAHDLGPVKVSFARTGVGRGPVTITMADGEELKGEYRVAFGGAAGMTFSGTRSSTALLISDGPVQFVATGPKTQMLCRGTSSTMGHGNGECQTYDGALWTMSW